MVSERDIQSYLSTKTERAAGGDRYDRAEGENSDQKAVRVALILAHATEHIVVDTQIDRAGRAQRCPLRANRLNVMRLFSNG